MRAAIIENNIVVNVIEVASLDFLPGLVSAGNADIGDTWNGAGFSKPAPPAPSVPQSVTSRQAHQALILRGQDVAVQAMIDAITDEVQRKLTQAEYDRSQVFERHRPLVEQFGAALGIDLDEWFIFASGL